MSGSGLTGAGLAVSALAQLLTSLVLVGTQEPAVYADIAVLTLVVLFLSMAFRVGIDRMVVPEMRSSSASGGSRAVVETGASLLSASIFMAVTGALLVGLGPVTSALNPTLTAPMSRIEAWCVAVWLASEVVRFVVSEMHRADSRFFMSAAVGNGCRAPMFLLLVVVLPLVGLEGRAVLLAAEAASSALVLGACASGVVARYPWWRVNPLPGLVRNVSDHSMLLAGTVAAVLIGGADVWLVGWFFPAEHTARYAFAVTLVGSLAMLTAALSGGMAPRLAELLSTGRRSETQAALRKPTRFIMGATLVSYLGLVLLGETVAVAVGGSAYKGITPLIAILGLAHVIGAAAGIAGWVLVFARCYTSMSVITVCAAVTGIALELVMGALLGNLLLLCVASSLATASIHVVSALVTHRALGLRTDVFARI